jgi:hypothetical protein
MLPAVPSDNRNRNQMMNDKPKPPFPKQKQPMPGLTAKMRPVPDHGEGSYEGSARLNGKKAVITGVVLMRGDIQTANHCRAIIDKAISELGQARHPRQQRGTSGELQID